MTTVTIEAGILTASRQERMVTGLLLPYGELGRTNLGRFSVPRGAFALPSDPAVVTLNVEHERSAPVGRAIALTDTVGGVVGTFSIAATPEGDAYLADVESGKRRSLSAEVADVVIRAGQAVSGRLFAAAACVTGAFPSATLLASDVGGDDVESESITTETITVDGVEYVRKTTSTYKTETTPTGDQPEADPDAESDQEEEDPVNTLQAKAPKGGAPLPKNRQPATGPTGRELYASLAEANRSGDSRMLYAALDQITQADVFDVVNTPQYLGELYNGVAYRQRFKPLVNHAELTSAKIIGWRFVEGKKPTVGDYAGGGAEVPSNEVDTEAVEATAARLAGGWNVDRIHRDFPNPEFWAAFFRAANEDYARKIDTKVRAFLTNAANHTVLEVSATGATTLGVSEAAYKIVKGGLALTRSERGVPDYAVLADDLFEEWAFTRQEDQLAFINSTFGLDGGSGFGAGKIENDSTLADGTALVGIKGAATLHELGGASPLRVSAEDIAKGNLTEALFGYYGIIGHDKGAVIKVQDEA